MRWIFIFFMGLWVFWGCSTCMADNTSSATGIVFHGDKVDVNIDEVTLDSILKAFKEAKGISYAGDKAVLERKLTGNIQGVSVEEALKKILAHVDHAVIYDKNKQVTGIRIAGKGKDVRIDDDETMEFFAAEGMTDEPTTGKPTAEIFEVKQDCGPPSGPITYAPGEKEKFIPEMNVQPPGGVSENPAITNDEIQKNVQPPGSLPPEMPQ